MARSLIAIQQAYIDTLNAGIARWSHRPNGGHSHRIARGARRTAERHLRQLGFTEVQIAQVIRDARDMAELERVANACTCGEGNSPGLAHCRGCALHEA